MAETSQASTEVSSQANADKRPVYEVGFHLLPSITEEGLGAAVEKVRALLNGAEIIAEGAPVKTTLAYTIERAATGKHEKFTQSYFGWIKFVAEDRSGLPALEASLLAQHEVLRAILIETVREDVKETPRRAVFASDRLEGETIKKVTEAEKGGEVSEEALDKSLEALTG
jgi:ribosomal protein S6